jgi:hypothetical protein
MPPRFLRLPDQNSEVGKNKKVKKRSGVEKGRSG